jgi:hypothetical protein
LAAPASAGRDQVLAALVAPVSADLAAARVQAALGQAASAGPVNAARVPQVWAAIASPPPTAAN